MVRTVVAFNKEETLDSISSLLEKREYLCAIAAAPGLKLSAPSKKWGGYRHMLLQAFGRDGGPASL
jgi:hypothetical protein